MKNLMRFTLLLVLTACPMAAQAQAPPARWAATLGGGPWVPNDGLGIAFDPAGNLLVTGWTPSSLNIGNSVLDSQTGFLAEYSPDGVPVRAIPVAVATNAAIASVGSDDAGNVYLAGSFSGDLTLGSVTLRSDRDLPYERPVFLAKYDPDWNLLWATNSVGGGGVNGMVFDRHGDFYLIGFFGFSGGSITLGHTTLTAVNYGYTQPSGNPVYFDPFIAKFDPDGNCVWAQDPAQAPGAAGGYYTVGSAVAIDPSTNVLVSGASFIAKYDQDGNNLWFQGWPGSSASGFHGIASDPSGNVYATGSFNGDWTFGSRRLSNPFGGRTFVAKFDGDGNSQWAVQTAAGVGDGANAICVDRSGNSFVTGYFYGRLALGATTLTSSSGVTDAFVAKVDPAGNWLWAMSAGGGTNGSGGTVGVLDASGNLYLGGYISTPATLGGITVTNPGIFLARIDAPSPPTLSIAQIGNQIVLSWPTNAAFSLQSAPFVTGAYTNAPGASSPYTNSVAGPQQYFRLQAN